MSTPTRVYQGTISEHPISGKHGTYYVARCEELDAWVTYDATAWDEDREPQPGDIVVLEDLTMKRQGWRANKARFLRPEDLR